MIKYLHHSELEGLTYALEDLPDGYHLFEHRKGGQNAPKRRIYLYGKYSAPLLSRFTTKIMIPYVQVRNIGFARSPNSSRTLFGYSTILLSRANVPIAPRNPRRRSIHQWVYVGCARKRSAVCSRKQPRSNPGNGMTLRVHRHAERVSNPALVLSATEPKWRR